MDELERVKALFDVTADKYSLLVRGFAPGGDFNEIIGLGVALVTLTEAIYNLTPEPPCPYAKGSEKEPWE